MQHIKVNIYERGRCGIQPRILVSPFSTGGQVRSPKSAPQHAPAIIGSADPF